MASESSLPAHLRVSSLGGFRHLGRHVRLAISPMSQVRCGASSRFERLLPGEDDKAVPDSCGRKRYKDVGVRPHGSKGPVGRCWPRLDAADRPFADLVAALARIRRHRFGDPQYRAYGRCNQGVRRHGEPWGQVDYADVRDTRSGPAKRCGSGREERRQSFLSSLRPLVSTCSLEAVDKTFE
jgi:hypothetical protein